MTHIHQPQPRLPITDFTFVYPRPHALPVLAFTHHDTLAPGAAGEMDVEMGMGMEMEIDLPGLAMDSSPASPVLSSCSTPPLPRTPGSPELATPPSTPFSHLIRDRYLYPQLPLPSPSPSSSFSPAPSPSPSALGRLLVDERRSGRQFRDETSRLSFHSHSGLRSDSLNPCLSPGPLPNPGALLKRQRSKYGDLQLQQRKIHRIRLNSNIDQEYLPRPVPVGVEFGLSPGPVRGGGCGSGGGSIVPAFYRGATAPVTITLGDRLPIDTLVRIRSILKCELHVNSCVPEILCRHEQWHGTDTDTNTTSTTPRSGSGSESRLVRDGYQTLELTIPTSQGSSPSHESDGTGLFTVRWTLDIELYATYPVHPYGHTYGQREVLIGSSSKNYTVLPSTAPSSAVLQDPIELRPTAYDYAGRCGSNSLEGEEGTTVQARLESTTYSPNSLVPLDLAIRIPQTHTARPSEGLSGLGLGMNIEEEEEEEWLEIQTNLVREQRITHHAPPSSLHHIQDLQAGHGHGQPAHEVLTRQDIGTISSTLPIPNSQPRPQSLSLSQSPSRLRSGEAQMIYHQQIFHLASRDGVWPYGYSTTIRSPTGGGAGESNTLSVVSNSFVLETKTSHYRRYRHCQPQLQPHGSSLIIHSIGYGSVPIIIGSVSEPRDAMYQAQAQSPDRTHTTSSSASFRSTTGTESRPSPDGQTQLEGVEQGQGQSHPHLTDTRLVALSNENGWKVPPPTYGYAITQPEYIPGMDWLNPSPSPTQTPAPVPAPSLA